MKIDVSYERDYAPKSFCTEGRDFVARLMVPEDYSQVREILPGVSRCKGVLEKVDVDKLLTMRLFIPFVVEEKKSKDIVGYAELIRVPHLGRKMDGRIERVVVTEAAQNCGIGTQLCEYVIEVAKHLMVGKIDLTVEKEHAKNMYKKLGFSKKQTEVFELYL